MSAPMQAERTIVLSPFSNSDLRDWPRRHYAGLVQLLLEALPETATIRVIGTPSQLLLGDEITRGFDASRVLNDCGRFAWTVIEELLQSAACVIGNNSGIAHLSASFGVPTVCVFGGSHQRAEWRPIGPRVTIISRAIWCSPCHLMRLEECRHGHACLEDIRPEDVATAALAMLDDPMPYRAEGGAAGIANAGQGPLPHG